MSSRVLIVDDDAGFRSVARDVLVDAGYAVVGEAGDGAGALAAVRELAPDWVLLDLQLPDADGFAVAEALTSGTCRPAIVLTSTRDGRELERLVAASPARGFVAKEALSASALAALLP